MVLQKFLSALQRDDWSIAEAMISELEAAGLWPQAAQHISAMARPHGNISEGFHLVWTVRGHRIREKVADDKILLDALRILLPLYSGNGLTLYRGESVARWRTGQFGSAWSPQEATAKMFARGLNAIEPEGGVLLRTQAQPDAIICGPSDHSRHWLGEEEYVVDRRRLVSVERIEWFPAVTGNCA